MTRKDRIPRSEAQANAETVFRRDSGYRVVHETSLEERGRRATTRPRALGPLLGWFRREWEAEFPTRLHERGVEPDSQLGAPRMAGALRSRLTMAVDGIGVHATDYNPATDTWSAGSAPRFPILDALGKLRRDKPLIAGSLEKLAYAGFDVYRHGEGRGWQTYQTEAYMRAEIDLLWQLWSAGQRDAGREVA